MTDNNRQGIILVTGAAKRLGRARALGAARRGLDVVVHHRASEKEAREVVDEIQGMGRRAIAVKAELTVAEHVDNMFDAIEEQLGPVRYLINSASVFSACPLMDTAAYEMDHFLSVNLTAQYRVIRRFVKRFASENGGILNMLDWRAWKPDPWFIAYNVSKAGLMNLTTNLAMDLAPKIRVNGLAPGSILPADHEAFDTKSPLTDLPIERWGSPEEIADAAMFLVLDGQYITGQVLSVDGGRHLL